MEYEFELKSQNKQPIKPEVKYSWQRLSQAIAGVSRVALMVTLALFLIIGTNSGIASAYSSPTPASQCTLSILNGSVEIQEAGSVSWEQGVDGMSLVAGTFIQTTKDSYALLTFFEGSTLTLEANTKIEIRQISINEKQATTILLKQWIGRTWSRVIKMIESGSSYGIETPSAVAVVRGTLFSTEVDDVGTTMVQTSEGLVSVSAQGEEVYVPAGKQTTVESGMSPSKPTKVGLSNGQDNKQSQDNIQGQDNQSQDNKQSQDSNPSQDINNNKVNEPPGQSKDKSQDANQGQDNKQSQDSNNNKVNEPLGQSKDKSQDNQGQDNKEGQGNNQSQDVNPGQDINNNKVNEPPGQSRDKSKD